LIAADEADFDRPPLANPVSPFGRRSVLTNRLHLVQDSLDVEGRRLLPLWKFPEGLEELSDDGLRGYESPQLLGIPGSIKLRFWRYLKRILSQVDHQRDGSRL
jgi:hypothetical protein